MDPIRKLMPRAILTIDAPKVIEENNVPPSLTDLDLGNSTHFSCILFILMTLWACYDIFREIWDFLYGERLPSVWMLSFRLLFCQRRSTRQISPDNFSSIDTTRLLEAAVEHLETLADEIIKKHRIEKEGLLLTIDRLGQEHKASVDAHQATVASLYESISTKDAYIDRLHSEKEEINTAAASANTRHQAEKKELQQTIDRQAEEHRTAVGSYPAQVAELKSQLARAESSLQEQTEALETAQESFLASQDADRSTIHDLQNQLSEARGQRDDAERKLRKSDSEVAKLQAATSSLTSMLEDGRENAAENESALKAIKREKKELTRTNGTILKNKQHLEARNSQLSTDLDRKTSELEQANRNLAALNEAAKHSVPRTEFEKMQKLRDEQEDELTTTLQDEADELNARIFDADRRVADLKKAKKTGKGRERNYKRAIRDAELAGTQQKANAESLRKQIGSATDALTAKDQVINKAREQISAATQQSQADRKSLEDKVSDQANELTKAKDEVNALKASLGDKDSQIRELQQAALPHAVECQYFDDAQEKGPKEAKRWVVNTLRTLESERYDIKQAGAAKVEKVSAKASMLEAEVAKLQKKLMETKTAAEKVEEATSWTIAKLKDECKSMDTNHKSKLDADNSPADHFAVLRKYVPKGELPAHDSGVDNDDSRTPAGQEVLAKSGVPSKRTDTKKQPDHDVAMADIVGPPRADENRQPLTLCSPTVKPSLTPEEVQVAKPESPPSPQSITPPTPIVFGSPVSASSSVPSLASPSPEPAEPSKSALSLISASSYQQRGPHTPKQSTPSTGAVERSYIKTCTLSSLFTGAPPYQPPKGLDTPSTNIKNSSKPQTTKVSISGPRSPPSTSPAAPPSIGLPKPFIQNAPRPDPPQLSRPTEIPRIGPPKDDDSGLESVSDDS
ncbi:MAG: hypothetical protein Q9179_002792 [Wetmoreana sp. 5 TL-2023]